MSASTDVARLHDRMVAEAAHRLKVPESHLDRKSVV